MRDKKSILADLYIEYIKILDQEIKHAGIVWLDEIIYYIVDSCNSLV